MPNLMKVIHGRIVFGKLRKGQLFSYYDANNQKRLARKVYGSKGYAVGGVYYRHDDIRCVNVPYERIC